MNVLGIDHTSYTVSSLERSLTFYVGLLGFEVVWQREVANRYFRDIVGFPDCVQFRSPPVAIDTGANKGSLAVCVLDPDGITVELLQRASPPPPASASR